MSEQAMTVFIVDDEAPARLVASFQLDGMDVRICEFTDGDSCIAAFDQSPDIIILDVDMPGTDGIAVCAALRAADGEARVIFASAHDDIETRLRAYDAGGDDYVVKPYVPEELARKLSVSMRAIQTRRDAASQTTLAQHAAFAAMSSMSEMGVILEFLRASFYCDTPDALGAALCGALSQYGQSGLVAMNDTCESHCYSTKGECSDLERSILAHTSSLGRVFQFRNRLAINYPHVTLLMSSLPLDNPDLVGRFRDHLAVLAEGAEARFIAMLNERQRLLQAESVINAVAELSRTLEDIDRHQESHREQILVIAHQQLVSLTNAFVHLGLSEIQEESLVELTQQAIDEIGQLQDYSTAMSKRLRGVTAQFKKVANQNCRAGTVHAHA